MVQFASYLRRVLCKTRLIFPRINGPIVSLFQLPLGNMEHLTTFYPFLTTFASSRFKISHFFAFSRLAGLREVSNPGAWER